MAFFDKISDMTKNAMDKTSDMIEINRLNSKIGTEQNKILALKGKIGEHYWSKFNDGEVLDDEATILSEQIKACLLAIDETNAKIKEIKENKAAPAASVQTTCESSTKKCQNCDADVPADKKFCSECGTPIKQDLVSEKTKICPGCCAEIPADKNFCSECGVKVD